ncbi:LAFA_0D04808g1_1 [Lachancea sp. 'fantastica']|nr:LAFA_0D04808g1_1 [Lachancea sp. 'fantastica']
MASAIAEDDEGGLFTSKSTMMANFEQWIKMATDNKINSRNSWNFALIDYFHDLNVLKDSEDNINFQKASATLDGCVKIYSSRVDSVANETGILLSGLAQRKNQTGALDAENGSGDNVDQENQDAEGAVTIDPSTGLPVSNEVEPAGTRRNYNRVLETTLVDFETLRMRELDQELTIDPLFKKALADFDEGGAKSLLINTLHIDSTGRIVFDATTSQDYEGDLGASQADSTQTPEAATEKEDQDEIMDETNDRSLLQEKTPEPHESPPANADTSMVNQSIDVEDEILALGMDFIDFKLINEAEICPSMQRLKDVVTDVQKAKSFIEDVNHRADNFLTEQDLQEAMPEMDGDGEDFDLPPDGDFEMSGGLYEGAADGDGDDDGEGNGEIGDGANDLSTITNKESLIEDAVTSVMDRDVMAYFDETLRKSWRGREHWKIRNFKDRLGANTGGEVGTKDNETIEKEKEAAKSKKAAKTKLSIDFFNFDHTVEERIFEKKKASIEMSQKSRTNPGHYLLPDDYHFSTQKITRLFLKPSQQMSFFSHRKPLSSGQSVSGTLQIDDTDLNGNSGIAELADQNFWAKNYQLQDQDEKTSAADEKDLGGDINDGLPNPFDDNDDGGIDFNQAFGNDSLGDADGGSLDPPASGSAGLTQPLGRPDGKVNYSRVSKKVDIKKLKDNIWTSITGALDASKDGGKQKSQHDQEMSENSPNGEAPIEESEIPETEDTENVSPFTSLKFSDITERISAMYSGDRRKDLSTSFCFICLLHLANEHGFSVDPTDKFDDLAIKIQTSLASAES